MNTAADSTDPLDIVFLLDVDNTLLDNDQIVADLQRMRQPLLGHLRGLAQPTRLCRLLGRVTALPD